MVGVDISEDMLRLAAGLGVPVIHAPDVALPLDSHSIDVSGDPASYSVHQIDHLGASAVDVQASTVEEAWASDLRAIARAGDYLFSLNRYLFVATKS